MPNFWIKSWCDIFKHCVISNSMRKQAIELKRSAACVLGKTKSTWVLCICLYIYVKQPESGAQEQRPRSLHKTHAVQRAMSCFGSSRSLCAVVIIQLSRRRWFDHSAPARQKKSTAEPDRETKFLLHFSYHIVNHLDFKIFHLILNAKWVKIWVYIFLKTSGTAHRNRTLKVLYLVADETGQEYQPYFW